MMTDENNQWFRHPRLGEYEAACRLVLTLLGPGLCPDHEICKGCAFELEEAVETVKAVLGEPVSRQRCKVCDALDTIWWSRDPDGDRVPKDERKMWCHQCGAVEPPSEFVKLPMEAP